MIQQQSPHISDLARALIRQMQENQPQPAPQGGGINPALAAQIAGQTSGGGASGSLAAAGPWAALAAAIIANESSAKRGGYRAEDDGEYAKDLLGGSVVTQDIDQRWGPKLFGRDAWNEDKHGLGADAMALTELASFDLGSAKDHLKQGSLAKLLKRLF